jgi:6-phosphofructokinase 1
VDETRRVLVASDLHELEACRAQGGPLPSFEPAGPRAELFFDPSRVACGVVTCGGLCPGVNNVIRSLVLTLHYGYGVRQILGFRYGYAGLVSKDAMEPVVLTPAVVENIHMQGGTLLATSRGPQDSGDMVDTLVRRGIDILFTIGGDGTLRGAHAIADEITRRGRPIAVVGVPKTIDNDLDWIERSFGFATAVDEARKVIVGAHAEARGAWAGIGLVKLMGRHSGFIAAHASLANSDVNFCLVPEVPLKLDGPTGFLNALERRLNEKHHAVIVIAEGVGQDLLQDPTQVERDASGNIRLKDIGPFLRDRIAAHVAGRGRKVTIKYIDPSYTIRSLPANSIDAEFCLMLGQHAAHAGLAGKTDTVVGYWNQRFTHVPIPLAIASRKTLDPHGEIWQCVLEATGQPAVMR